MNFFGNFSVFTFFPVTFQRKTAEIEHIISIISFSLYNYHFAPFFKRWKSVFSARDGRKLIILLLACAENGKWRQKLPFPCFFDIFSSEPCPPVRMVLVNLGRRDCPAAAFSSERSKTTAHVRETESAGRDTNDRRLRWYYLPTAKQ